jgi:hypothetical protein
MLPGELYVLGSWCSYGCYDNGESTLLDRSVGLLRDGDVIVYLGEDSVNQAGTRTSKVFCRFGVGWLVLFMLPCE